jgi:hypothetical protein
VAAWGVAGIAPLLRGEVHVLSDRSRVLADYVVLNVGDVQFGSPHTFEYYGTVEPVYTVRLQGVEYAWVYENERYGDLLQAVEQQVDPGDWVLFAGKSQLSKHWPAERPKLVLDPAADEESSAQALQRASLQGKRVWYVAFDGDEEAGDGVRRQLDTHALRTTQVTLSPLTVTAYLVPTGATFAALQPEPMSEVDFAGGLGLVGLGISETKVVPSQKLDVALRWLARFPIEGDYSMFVHLLDEEHKRLAQHDELLLDGAGQPTSLWTPGGENETRLLMSIPADAPSGDYRLAVGVYDATTADRLWLENVDGLQNDTVYPLALIHVEPPPGEER